MPRKISLDTVKAALTTFERGDLTALKAEIERLLSEEAAGTRTLTGRKRARRTHKPSPGSQWIEYKRIRGYGPYAYLRRVETDGRVSSHYMGKTPLTGQGGKASKEDDSG